MSSRSSRRRSSERQSNGHDGTHTLFRDLTGRDPDGLWSAPGRANLIGEHTDYNEGFVLPFAIDRAATVAAGVRTDGIIRVASSQTDDVVTIPLSELDRARRDGLLHNWSGYPLGVALVLGEQGADLSSLPGIDLVIDSDVPVGAGLSSSAAVECSVALALDDIWQLGLSRQELAVVGQRAENHVTGAPTGIMDQSASLLGVQGAAVFLDCRNLEAETVPLHLDEADLSILVIDTRVTHEHATGGYSARRQSCRRAARELGVPALRDLSIEDLDAARQLLDEETFRRVRHVVTEDQRVLDTVRALRERWTPRCFPCVDARRLRDLGPRTGCGRGNCSRCRRDRGADDRGRIRRRRDRAGSDRADQ